MTNSRASRISDSSSEKLNTVCCGKISKNPITYFCQITAIFIIIITSILNITINNGEKIELWICLLSACLGYLLPAPKLKKQDVTFLSNSPVEQFIEILP